METANAQTHVRDFEVVLARSDRALLRIVEDARGGKKPLKDREAFGQAMGSTERSTFYRVLKYLTDPGLVDSNIFGFEGKRMWFPTQYGFTKVSKLEHAIREMQRAKSEALTVDELLKALEIINFDKNRQQTRRAGYKIHLSQADKFLFEIIAKMTTPEDPVRKFLAKEAIGLKGGEDRATAYRKLHALRKAKLLQEDDGTPNAHFVSEAGFDRVEKLEEAQTKMKAVEIRVESVMHLLRSLVSQDEMHARLLRQNKHTEPKDIVFDGHRMV